MRIALRHVSFEATLETRKWCMTSRAPCITTIARAGRWCDTRWLPLATSRRGRNPGQAPSGTDSKSAHPTSWGLKPGEWLVAHGGRAGSVRRLGLFRPGGPTSHRFSESSSPLCHLTLASGGPSATSRRPPPSLPRSTTQTASRRRFRRAVCRRRSSISAPRGCPGLPGASRGKVRVPPESRSCDPSLEASRGPGGR